MKESAFARGIRDVASLQQYINLKGWTTPKTTPSAKMTVMSSCIG
jgi:hypothetical protein